MAKYVIVSGYSGNMVSFEVETNKKCKNCRCNSHKTYIPLEFSDGEGIRADEKYPYCKSCLEKTMRLKVEVIKYTTKKAALKHFNLVVAIKNI